MTIFRQTLIALSLAAVALPALAADQITVTTGGGAYSTSIRKAYFEPYMEKTGAKITEDVWNNEMAKVKGMVDKKAVSWDVVTMESADAMRGCDEGILEKLDWKALGGKSQFLPGAVQPCFVGSIVWSNVFAFNEKKFSGAKPSSINDFFDLKKFPGARGMRKNPKVNLEMALMADGVAPKDVYKVLATKEGQDRAFRKLDSIKGNIKFWEAGAQAPQLLDSGEVVMTTAFNGRIADAVKNEKKPFKIVWDGQIYDFDGWSIPKGTPKKEAAMKFVAWVSQADVMANQSKYIAYGPTNKGAVSKISPEILKDLPTNPENMKKSMPASSEFWADHFEELNTRFTSWLAQ